ncbi:hypothetical protein GCM10010495_07760 [Kitasatospora herbaricolor]|uniref:hypothetical protein n=1 Tax=Kitasatospora herbaricolor TaxID=68217 RepID=UPI00174C5072|nr:hypothetical protein [Kitasatospora herbaricolor]MDQ0309786.1 hypothetical protein [Kitasatospora herbaricolor]GGU99613.1 hypothetical protein GCM10010495_07760 [Kitasatospora herbaricolor]
MTDRMTRLFNRELARPGSPLLGIDLGSDRFPALTGLGYRYLSRPMFFGEEEIRRFEADLLGVVDLLTSLPERLFDGDAERVCRALGVDPAKAALVGGFGKERPARFGRVDAYHDGESLKILEFNASSQTGGQEWVGPAAAALLEFEGFRSFAGRHGLHHLDTTALLAGALRAAGAAVSAPEPVVALIEGPGGMAAYGHAWRPLQRLLRAEGLECHLGEIGDLRVRGGRVLLGEVTVDVVYRLFDLDQVVGHPQGRELAGQLRDAHQDGRVALWSPLETDLNANKRWMAYLSDPRLRSHLSTEERRLVDRVLPWTRALTPGATAHGRELLELCRERREHLILKLDESFASQGITCGWLVDDRQWEQALRQAASVGAVVQERVVPRQEPVFDPVTGRTEPWDSCLGLYWMPSGFAGGGARLVPSGRPFTLEAEHKRLAGIYLYPDAVTSDAVTSGTMTADTDDRTEES